MRMERLIFSLTIIILLSIIIHMHLSHKKDTRTLENYNDVLSHQNVLLTEKLTNRDKLIALQTEQKAELIQFVKHSDDFERLCRLVEAEAGGESKDCQRKVAEVVLNRAETNKLSVRTVILRPKQFSCISDGRFFKCTGHGYDDVVIKAILNPNKINAWGFAETGSKVLKGKKIIEVVDHMSFY